MEDPLKLAYVPLAQGLQLVELTVLEKRPSAHNLQTETSKKEPELQFGDGKLGEGLPVGELDGQYVMPADEADEHDKQIV